MDAEWGEILNLALKMVPGEAGEKGKEKGAQEQGEAEAEVEVYMVVTPYIKYGEQNR